MTEQTRHAQLESYTNRIIEFADAGPVHMQHARALARMVQEYLGFCTPGAESPIIDRMVAHLPQANDSQRHTGGPINQAMDRLITKVAPRPASQDESPAAGELRPGTVMGAHGIPVDAAAHGREREDIANRKRKAEAEAGTVLQRLRRLENQVDAQAEINTGMGQEIDQLHAARMITANALEKTADDLGDIRNELLHRLHNIAVSVERAHARLDNHKVRMDHIDEVNAAQANRMRNAADIRDSMGQAHDALVTELRNIRTDLLAKIEDLGDRVRLNTASLGSLERRLEAVREQYPDRGFGIDMASMNEAPDPRIPGNVAGDRRRTTSPQDRRGSELRTP